MGLVIAFISLAEGQRAPIAGCPCWRTLKRPIFIPGIGDRGQHPIFTLRDRRQHRHFHRGFAGGPGRVTAHIGINTLTHANAAARMIGCSELASWRRSFSAGSAGRLPRPPNEPGAFSRHWRRGGCADCRQATGARFHRSVRFVRALNPISARQYLGCWTEDPSLRPLGSACRLERGNLSGIRSPCRSHTGTLHCA